MSNNNSDLETYTFRGKKGETVPYGRVKKLIVKEGVRVWHKKFFDADGCPLLQEVILPHGLTRIGSSAFSSFQNLLEIKIPSTVRHIESKAFYNCGLLTKVEFILDVSTSSSSHQLTTIHSKAFAHCTSLARIKLPSSATTLLGAAFLGCFKLIEVNLSKTCITEVKRNAFFRCLSLQTVSLPNTLEQIGLQAFYSCFNLVTVVVPLDSRSICIGVQGFGACKKLANLALPRGSTATEDSFDMCDLLHQRYGKDSSRIVEGLVRRFENFRIHGMCYDDHHSGNAVQEVLQCIKEQCSLVDAFGMTPFHLLFSMPEPNGELLQVLLDQEYPYHIWKWKDANGHRPLDYLMNNWVDVATATLLELTLQKWMIDPLVNWGAMLWVEAIKTKVRAVLSEQDKTQRFALIDDVYSAFGQYERMESISILELALWEGKLKRGWTSSNGDGSNKRRAIDRVECRCLCGSDVLIPNVTAFLFA